VSAVIGIKQDIESAAEYDVLIAPDQMVSMRDGVRLATDLYLPTSDATDASSHYPSILIRTPYDKRADEYRLTGEYFARRGYTFVVQDCRGRYRSEGTFSFLLQEPTDGYDTIEWIADQPWSSGSVGTMGTSYFGWTQTAAATLNPPHLTAMVVNQAGVNAFASSVRHNGAMELRWLTWAFRCAVTGSEARERDWVHQALDQVHTSEWLQSLPLRPGLSPLALAPSYEDWVLDLYTTGDHGYFWEQRGFDFTRHWEQHADVPILLCGSWYDSYARSTVEQYAALSATKHGPVHLIMGPWTHGTADTLDSTFAGDLELGSKASVAGNLADDFNHLHLQWFDRWLKEIDNGVDQTDPVRIFVMGNGETHKTASGRIFYGGSWRREDTFPLERTQYVDYYFHGSGELKSNSPDDEDASTTFTYDPNEPVPTIGGNISSLSDQMRIPRAYASRIPYELRRVSIVKVGGQDQRTDQDVFGCQPPFLPLSARSDVLVFQTETLDEPIEVTGPITAILYVSSTVPDTDFTVKLVDVFPPSDDYPNGYHLNITDSIFRCRYRNSFAQPTLMEPDEVYRIEIPMYPTSTVFAKGHRIRVDISSSNFPRFDPNPNTGEPIGRHRRTKIAQNTLYHCSEYSSHILLPILRVV
jgi:uncharacterized protein